MMQYLQTKLVTVVLLILITGLTLRLFAGDGSLVHIYLLNTEINELEHSLELRTRRNDQLTRVTRSLKNDYDMVETIARRDMSMIGKDEIFFVEQ